MTHLLSDSWGIGLQRGMIWDRVLGLAVVLSAVASASFSADVCYEYDLLGRITSAIYDSDSGVSRINYSYDKNGNRLVMDQKVVGGVLPCTPPTSPFDGNSGGSGNGGSTNQPPVALNDLTATFALNPVSVAVLANDTDPDNDTLSIQSIGSSSLGAASIVGTNIVFTPSANVDGTAVISYVASDGNGGTAGAILTIAVISSGGGGLD